MKQQTKELKSSENMLDVIRIKSDGGKNMVKIRELIENKEADKSDTESIKQLFQLLAEGKVTTIVNRRDKDELYICYIGNKKDKAKPEQFDVFSKMMNFFSLYATISKSPSIKEFLTLTECIYSDYELFKYVQQANLNFTETRILLNTINGFIAGLHPAYLFDMNLNASDLAYYTEKFLEQDCILLKQELIRTHIDIDGTTCKIGITKRTLKLMQNIPISMEFESKKRQSGLYIFKPFGSISEKKMYYNSSAKRLFENISKIINKTLNKESLNISLLLYGPSGTGKTEFAYQLAKNLNSDIIQFDFSQIQSKWIGETEKNIKSIFNEYYNQLKQTKKPLIMLMNEADGLMTKRVSVNSSHDIYSNLVQAQLLDVLEEFKGILVATTNMYQNIDTAFHRRFLFKCKIDLPDTTTKRALLKDSFIINHLNKSNAEKLLNSSWSAAQLRNIERKIEQLELLDEIDEEMILELINDEGMINTSKIGY